ncbi:MAG TPA: MMPL family transporter, partial [Spirochaetota bacterium]|nr:MMPL family transporter [Spirochaetota bacterium]
SQPVTLKKIDELSTRLKNLSKPKARIDGKPVKPVGKVISITDTIKLVYKVFYHDDNEQFNKLPDVDRDNIADRTLTDRDIMSVCISQFSGSSPDNYKSMATTDMKLMQYMVFARSDTADFLKKFNDAFLGMAKQYFPENDPYVEKIVVSGLPAINMTMNHMLFTQQIQSIVLTLGVVFLCCVFMLRSFLGGLMCIVPITMTVLINLGIMGWYDFPINYSTVLIASIAIGAGIDYSIHFVERFKIEYRDKGNDFQNAYFNTLNSTGRSIVVSSLSVGLGFGVLMLSTFKMLSTSGLMVALAMILAATAALTTLPALLNWLKPEFLMKQSGFKTRNKNKE